MRAFDYHRASSVDEAIGLLSRYGEDALLMAGGTALLLLMKQGLVRPAHVVGIRDVPELAGIASLPDGGLRIGATATLREAERSAAVRTYCPALADTFRRVATVRVRNQATVGGNLAHADPAQDPPAMLLALDATVLARGPSGEREIALPGLFVDFFTTSLAREEVLTAVRLPPLPRGARATYVKFLPRSEDDYATVSVAVVLARSADGAVNHARIAIGAAGAVPLRARRVEEAVLGARATPPRIAEAAALVREEVDPIDDVRGPAAYKREMARVWTERALRSLAT